MPRHRVIHVTRGACAEAQGAAHITALTTTTRSGQLTQWTLPEAIGALLGGDVFYVRRFFAVTHPKILPLRCPHCLHWTLQCTSPDALTALTEAPGLTHTLGSPPTALGEQPAGEADSVPVP
jgi:hypothetical protein